MSVDRPISTMSSRLSSLFADARQRLGRRLFVLLALMAVAGLMEGIGVAMILPLLGMVGIGEGYETTIVATTVARGFALLGMQPNLTSLVAIIIGVFVLQTAVFVTQSWLAASLQSRYVKAWRDALLASYLRATWSFFHQNRAGELINALINETNRVGGAFYLLSQLVATALVTTIYVALALVVSWQVTVVLLLGAGVIFFLTRGLMGFAYRIGVDISERGHELQEAANEFVGGAKLVKATATEQLAEAKFMTLNERMRPLFFWSSFTPNALRAIFELTAIIGLCVLLAVGTTAFGIDSASILVVLAIFLRLYPKISVAQQNLQLLNVYTPAVETARRLFDAAASKLEIEDERDLPRELLEKHVSVEVVDLCVAYDEAAVLDRISFGIPAGHSVGIVGSSGAGKSTLVDCLLRLVEPRAGDVLIGGHKLNDLPTPAWRRSVGYVPQDTFLFNASIRENLLWGHQDVSDEQMIAAARQANAHTFISQMPSGYDTMAGDRGVRLSGGQRQRIGLARALVGRPKLLILDEATSSLDSDSERVVLDAIDRLHGELTIIVVAHRLSTVRDADSILVLESGRLVEHGTWSELLDGDRRFRRLWDLQQQSGS